MFKVIKVFNNNVILCTEGDSNKEVILVGGGIGFGIKSNEIFTKLDKIEKFFVINEDKQENFKDLYSSINPTYIGVCTEALSTVEEVISWDLNDKSHMALLDHIIFAIEKYFDNIFLENPFRLELKALYTREWDLSKKIIDFINSRLDIKLSEDEVAFVTMHISGILNNTKAINGAKEAVVIKDTIDYLDNKFNLKLNKDSLYYNRLVVHIRLAINRAIKGVKEDNVLLDHIKEKLNIAYTIAEDLGIYLKENYMVNLSEDEIGFVALHLDRVIKNKN